MIAPKGPGHTVRWEYQNGQVQALFAVEQVLPEMQDHWRWLTLKGLAERAGSRQTSKKQRLIYLENKRFVRRLSELVKSGFETLVEAGYQPELYFECL